MQFSFLFFVLKLECQDVWIASLQWKIVKAIFCDQMKKMKKGKRSAHYIPSQQN